MRNARSPRCPVANCSARFARLIVVMPVMLLDEPLNSLDHRTQEVLLAVLDEWHATGKTLVTVMHNLALARSRFPDALLWRAK